jgi:Fe-Mn family superoxide dismutase
LDMHEHAYRMDFGARAADYVATVMGAIDWSNADWLFTHATKA